MNFMWIVLDTQRGDLGDLKVETTPAGYDWVPGWGKVDEIFEGEPNRLGWCPHFRRERNRGGSHMTRPISLTLSLVAYAFAALAAADENALLMTAPRAANAPTTDGRLAPGEWAAAAASTGFVALGSRRLAAGQPIFYAAFGAHALYVAARVPCPKGKQAVANAKQRDGAVWQDDSVELFVAPRPGAPTYYQFSTNAAGILRDGQGMDGKWNAVWACKTGREPSAWVAEFAIPWRSIGLPQPPSEIGFNITWNCRTGWPGHYTWAPMERTFHEPRHFAALRLRPAGALLRLTEIALPKPSELKVGVEVVASPARARGAGAKAPRTLARAATRARAATFTARVTCPDKTTLDFRQTLGGSEHVFELPRHGLFPLGGDYALEYNFGRVARGRVAFRVRPALDLKVEQRMLAGFVDVDADLSGMGAQAKGARLDLSLDAQPGGKPQRVASLAVDASRRVAHTIDMRRFPAGRYTLTATAAAANGKTLTTAQAAVRKPPRPEWLGCKEGVTDKVLPPWTPVEVEGARPPALVASPARAREARTLARAATGARSAAVRVWGRTYEFARGPLPSKIETRQKSVLAGPVALAASVGDREQRWDAKPARVVERKPDHATLDSAMESSDLRVAGRVRVEYDGMMRIDLTVKPKHPGQPVSLTLEIPLKPAHAKYLYHFPGRWRSAFNVGALPAKGWEGPFKPYVWLGDESRGLAWFCESDRHWRPADRKKTVQIVRERGRTVLRLNLLHEVQLAKPFTYTIGFEATPVKPLKPDVWDYRIVHAGNYGLEKRAWSPPLSITWPAEGNFNVVEGMLEAWVRPRFDPNPPAKRNDPGRGRYNRNFFTFHFGGYTVGYYWNIDDRGMRVYVHAPDGKYPIVFGARCPWKRGEWHHIAVSWGKEVRLYHDGKLIARRAYRGLLRTTPKDLRGGQLILGAGLCEMDVDEFCISDVQREPRGFAGPLKPGAHTLLLENFDRRQGQTRIVQTIPVKAGGGPGRVDRGVALVAGRFGKAAALAHTGPPLTTLDKYQKLGVRTICFHEHWTPIQDYHVPWAPAELRSLVKACHDHGIQLLLYWGYEISNIHPGWDAYHVECLKHPRGGGYHRKPEQRAYMVCYRSAWQDYIAWSIAKAMDEYDIDGVYLDGTAHPHACDNKWHGCGYVGEDGKRHVTYGIFAARQMMRRIYAIVKTRKPRGQINVHNSTMMVISSLAWATSSWDGEQFGSIPRGPRFDEVIPLDAFRAEFMGQQWGVPAEFLCYNRPYTQREALAFTLLHDVLVRPYDVEFASKIWNAMAKFGRKQARWLPYWENGAFAATNTPNVKVSLYTHGAQGLMLVVSNLSSDLVQARVRLSLDNLELAGKPLRAADALTGEPVALTSGALALPLPPMHWRLVYVRPR